MGYYLTEMESTPLLFCSADGCSEPRADQDPKATNRHCLAHRADAQRKYNGSRLEQQHGKGYVKGVEDMRDLLAGEFERLGAGEFNGVEAAWHIRQAIGPLAVNGNGAEKPAVADKEPVKA